MKSLEPFLSDYAAFEASVRAVMVQLFSDTCGLCTACCCRVDICEEARQSAFLSLLLDKQELTAEEMDDRFGWLDLHGCSLEYGRPPVCHAYFCDELLGRLPDEQSRWVAKMLGRLVEYIGENAVKGSHLVELGHASDLEKLDMDALHARLEEAQTALDAIEQFLETGLLPRAERDLLENFAVPEV